MKDEFEIEERMSFADLVAELSSRDLKKDPYTFPETVLRLEIVRAELEESGGEVTDEIDSALEALFENRRLKAQRIMQFCQRKEAQIKQLKAEAKLYNAIAKRRAEAIAALHRIILFDMRNRGEKTLETDLFTIARVKYGKAKVGLAEGVDLEAVGSEFVRVIPPVEEKQELDKIALYAYLKDAGLLPTEPGEFDVEEKFRVVVDEQLKIK